MQQIPIQASRMQTMPFDFLFELPSNFRVFEVLNPVKDVLSCVFLENELLQDFVLCLKLLQLVRVLQVELLHLKEPVSELAD